LLAESDYQRRFSRKHPVVANAVNVPPKTVQPGTDRVVYLGTVTEARGCSLMIDVARALKRLPGPPVQFEVIGDAPERSCADALRRADRDGTLSWQGFLPSPTALFRLSGALAGLSLLDDLPNFRCSLPTKVVEYAAVGIPVITTPLPIADRIVRGANCGVVVPWRDPQAVVDAVLDLRDDPARAAQLGRNGHRMALEQYDWQTLSGKFVQHLEMLADVRALTGSALSGLTRPAGGQMGRH
jgi:glycosyltransferase involved in cell wall biosynthesis